MLVDKSMQAKLNSQINSLLQQPHAAIMGIINVTPDSFSDGGENFATDAAVQHGLRLVAEGANILDIGGESTRPDAKPVSLTEELDRIIPVIEKMSLATDVPISVDTYKPTVMLEAVKAGAQMINDVQALRMEGAIEAAAKLNVPVCLMHMQGDPSTMQKKPKYENVNEEVSAFLQSRIDACIKAGVAEQNIIVDPGIGFGKTLQHNLELLAGVPELTKLGYKVLIGVSRKSMIEHLLKRSAKERVAASVGLAVQSVLNGAKIVRVHDVFATHDAIRAVEAVSNAK